MSLSALDPLTASDLSVAIVVLTLAVAVLGAVVSRVAAAAANLLDASLRFAAAATQLAMTVGLTVGVTVLAIYLYLI
jgi:hypothetical protein